MNTIKSLATAYGQASRAQAAVDSNLMNLKSCLGMAAAFIVLIVAFAILAKARPEMKEAFSVSTGVYGSMAGLAALGSLIFAVRCYRDRNRILTPEETMHWKAKEKAFAAAHYTLLNCALGLQYIENMTRKGMVDDLGEDSHLHQVRKENVSRAKLALALTFVLAIFLIVAAKNLPNQTSDDLKGRNIALGSLGILFGVSFLAFAVSVGLIHRFNTKKLSDDDFDKLKKEEVDFVRWAEKHRTTVAEGADGMMLDEGAEVL